MSEQGPAQSTNEDNVYQALTEAKVDFTPQYPLNGGRTVRGGQVIDAVVWLPPRPMALYVQGRRWHSGAFGLEDLIKQTDAEKAGFEVILLWEEETNTLEAARLAIKKKVL